MKSEVGPSHLKITDTATGVTFTIHLQPRASRNEICGVQAEELKIRLTSPPVEDAANRHCLEFLAKMLGVTKSRLDIVAGARSRHKVVSVRGVNCKQLLALLDGILGQTPQE
ncbi:MAG: DUF167 domain-containing protein [Geobacteraceae bacterium]